MDKAHLHTLTSISGTDFDTAAFGGIIVDETGTIEGYNQYESDLARLPAERVIGRNFFRTVAPCTARRAFEGRFLEFVALDDTVSDTFAYFFPFAHGDANVLVTFVKLEIDARYLIVIERVDEETIEPLKDFYSPIDLN